MKIAFVEHPCTKADKAELRSKGFMKIVDARYAPSELPAGAELFMKPKPKKAKAEKE